MSTEEQGDSGLGLEAQRQAITAKCAQSGWRLLHVYEDRGASGKSMKRRPQLAEALAAVRSGEAAGIVVAKLDRLSRSMIDFVGLMEEAHALRWNIVALDLGIDLATPAGEAMASVMATFAQLERRLISQRTKEALAVRRAQGVRLGAPVRIPDEVERRIRRRRLEGATLHAIAAELNGDRVPTARGGTIWRPSALQRVLARAGAQDLAG